MYLRVLVLTATFGHKMVFFRHLGIIFLLVHGQVNWKITLVRSNKCTTRTTRTLDFATPVPNDDLHRETVTSVLLTLVITSLIICETIDTPLHIDRSLFKHLTYIHKVS